MPGFRVSPLGADRHGSYVKPGTHGACVTVDAWDLACHKAQVTYPGVEPGRKPGYMPVLCH